MKILTVVGARPQFIKSAVVSRELRKKHEEILVHTGQHYDYNMSDIFFDELEIPKPNYNLGISGGSHGEMTGKMIMELEKVIIKENPDGILLYGDTNSTMSAGIAGVKLGIPIFHVEAGNRLGSFENPEEINRKVTDHISSLLLCCTESAKKFLDNEGLKNSSFVVGDPMYDAYLYYSKKTKDIEKETIVDLFDNKIEIPKKYNYMTCHRQENTDDINKLVEILDAMENREEKCIYPVHPRNQKMVQSLIESKRYNNILFSKPVGYLTSINLLNNCNKVVTDSGGLQREAFFAEKQCVTVFDYVVWPETMIDDRNVLSKPHSKEIEEKLNKNQQIKGDMPFGDGNSAKKIVEKIEEYINGRK